MNITKKLEEWVSHKLITEEQSSAIGRYERERSNTSSMVLYAFLLLGAFAVGIGVISIIASNWDNISSGVKLAVMSLALVSLAVGYIWSTVKEKSGASEVCLMLLFLGCLAYIGLVEQIFNLYTTSYREFLFWTIITLPLAFMSKRPFIPFIWVMCFVHFFLLAVVFSDSFEIFMEYLTDNMEYPAILLLAALFMFTVWQCGQRLLKKHNVFKTAFNTYFVLSMLFFVMIMDYTSMILYEVAEKRLDSDLNIVYLITVVSLILCSLLATLKKERLAYSIVLVSVYVLLICAAFFPLSVYFYTALTMIVLGSVAVLSAANSRRSMFNFFTFLLGVRIIVLYLQLSFGLLETGIGFILLGIVVVVTASLWYKYKGLLAEKSKELLR